MTSISELGGYPSSSLVSVAAPAQQPAAAPDSSGASAADQLSAMSHAPRPQAALSVKDTHLMGHGTALVAQLRQSSSTPAQSAQIHQTDVQAAAPKHGARVPQEIKPERAKPHTSAPPAAQAAATQATGAQGGAAHNLRPGVGAYTSVHRSGSSQAPNEHPPLTTRA